MEEESEAGKRLVFRLFQLSPECSGGHRSGSGNHKSFLSATIISTLPLKYILSWTIVSTEHLWMPA